MIVSYIGLFMVRILSCNMVVNHISINEIGVNVFNEKYLS